MAKKLWNKDFILLLQGSTVSVLGDLMYSVAIGYWVYEKTGSNSLMGIMSAISMFVTMFLSPFAGSIVDKCNRKWVLVGMDVMQGVIMLTVGAFAYFDKLSVPGVLVAAFLAALGSVFYSPAVNTLMIDIIPKDDMVRGQSTFSGSSTLVNVLGTAFSGVVVAFFGVPLIVIFNGLSNLYSALSELFVRVPKTVQQGESVTVKSVINDLRSAIKVIFSNPYLKVFVPSVLAINLLGAGPMALLLPFCLEKGFTVKYYGYLMFIWMIASFLGVVILGAFKISPRARYYVMAVGFCLSCVFSVLAYMSTGFIAVGVFGFIFAFLNIAGNTILSAALKLALPEENRAAILGCIESASVGGSALSTLIYGFLGDVFPLYIVFTAGTVISVIPMVYLCFHPRTKAFILSH